MVRVGFALLAAGALALGAATEASAQGRGDWWNPVVLEATSGGGSIGSILEDVINGSGRERDRANEPGRQEARGNGRGANNQSARNGNGNGPPFCRNGQGHPVHGRQWCRDKGWVGGSTWAREGWGDVIFGDSRPNREREVNQGTIGGILGDIVLGRLSRFGRDAGLSGALDGRWLPVSSGGSVLQVRMGGSPIAELADLNRDGRAEVVLLNHAY